MVFLLHFHDLIIIGENSESAMSFLQTVYPKFKLQYEWFHSTQIGKFTEYDYNGTNFDLAFKWRGRKGKHILTSGMDDYPRSSTQHPGDLHVDLLSWMAYFANSLERVANILELKADAKKYQKHYKQMMHTLDGLTFMI